MVVFPGSCVSKATVTLTLIPEPFPVEAASLVLVEVTLELSVVCEVLVGSTKINKRILKLS